MKLLKTFQLWMVVAVLYAAGAMSVSKSGSASHQDRRRGARNAHVDSSASRTRDNLQQGGKTTQQLTLTFQDRKDITYTKGLEATKPKQAPGRQGKRKAPSKGTKKKTKKPKVVVVTALHKNPCSRTLVGNYLEVLSLKNKDNFAKSRGYTLHWYTNDIDPGLSGSWNKIRALQNVLANTPPSRAEWLLWIDSDALVLGIEEAIPFERYEGKDFILWGGNDNDLQKGDPHGFNAGVMLLRNTNWTRTFLSAVAEYGTEKFQQGRTFEKMLRKDLGEAYVKGLKDQIAIAHLVQQNPEIRSKVMCADHHLHRMWHFDWTTQQIGSINSPFIVHWPGCAFCKPGDHNLDQKQCVQSFLEVYAAADKMFTQVLNTGAPFDVNSIEQIMQKVW